MEKSVLKFFISLYLSIILLTYLFVKSISIYVGTKEKDRIGMRGDDSLDCF